VWLSVAIESQIMRVEFGETGAQFYQLLRSGHMASGARGLGWKLSGLESLSALSGLGRADATTASIWAAYLLSSAAIEERWSF
jgi:hypothetical protein